MKKRLIQGLIASVVVSSFIMAPVTAAPEDKVKSLESQKSQVQAQASQVNSQLVSLLVDYKALQKDMGAQEKKIEQAGKDLTVAEKKEKKQYEDMKLRIKYMYERGDATFMETLVSAESFTDLVNKTEYVQKVHKYDRDMLQEYEKTKEKVKNLKDDLEAEHAEMKDMSLEMQSQKSNLESTLTVMRSQIADFDSQLAQAKEEAAKELARIEAEEAAQKEEEERENSPEVSESAGEEASDSDSVKSGDTEKEQAEPKEEKQEETRKEEEKKEEVRKEEPKKEESKKEDTKKEEPKKQEPEEETTKPSGSGSSKPSNASLGQQIANKGCQYIGNPYVYAGNSLTNGIDCSGFVYQIHRMFGISTPRTSSALRTHGKAVSYSEKLPGDVICYSGHVAIYIGNNTIVHASNSAPYPKGGIKTTSPVNYRTVLAVRRYW